MFQLVGRNSEPAAWLSPNGRLWQAGDVIDPSRPTAAAIDIVVPVGAGLLSFGRVDDTRSAAAAWASLDGRSWERMIDWPTAESTYVTGATALPTMVVVTGQQSGPDGIGEPFVWLGRAH